MPSCNFGHVLHLVKEKQLPKHLSIHISLFHNFINLPSDCLNHFCCNEGRLTLYLPSCLCLLKPGKSVLFSFSCLKIFSVVEPQPLFHCPLCFQHPVSILCLILHITSLLIPSDLFSFLPCLSPSTSNLSLKN